MSLELVDIYDAKNKENVMKLTGECEVTWNLVLSLPV